MQAAIGFRSAVGQTLGHRLSRAQQPRRLTVLRPAVESPERAPTTISSSTIPEPASKYAVLDLNGFRQVVEEGRAYTCSKDALQQLPSPGSLLQFHNIMALRDGGRFVTGKPYLTDALVEAELVEEFAGPVPSLTAADAAAAALPPLSPVMAKYKVTRILGSSSSSQAAQR